MLHTKLFIWILALSREGCDLRCDTRHTMGAELSDLLFGQNKPLPVFFFSKFWICVYVCFVGNVAVSVWLASVWMIINVITLTEWGLSLWMLIGRYGLYGPYLYDYHLNYPAHQCVITDYQQSVCIFGYISVCLAIRVCMWVCTAYIQSYFCLYLFLLLKLFLLYFFLVK